MDCGTYIETFLSAHADGELTGDELRAAEEHVASCAECHERLEEERALKRLLHDHLVSLKTPAQVRDRIRVALDREQTRESGAEAQPAIRRASRSRWLRPRIWVPAAIAALLVIGLVRMGMVPSPQNPAVPEREASSAQSVPMFDLAVNHLASFEKKFEPNVPSGSPADISDAYLNHKMPGYLWNFGPGGYRLVGGRLEQLPDGRMAAFTYYQGESGGILCTYVRSTDPMPPGALHQSDEHAYYSYKGYSICLSRYPRGNFICVLVTRRPMPEFMETVAASMM